VSFNFSEINNSNLIYNSNQLHSKLSEIKSNIKVLDQKRNLRSMSPIRIHYKNNLNHLTSDANKNKELIISQQEKENSNLSNFDNNLFNNNIHNYINFDSSNNNSRFLNIIRMKKKDLAGGNSPSHKGSLL